MGRLMIDITDQQHQSLKALAALQGKTIMHDKAWQDLKTLLENRIHDGVAGKVSAKNIAEILDEELSEKPA